MQHVPSITWAETAALAGTSFLAACVSVPYALNLAGIGVKPMATVAIAAIVAFAAIAQSSSPVRRDLGWLLGVAAFTLMLLVWLAWPSLLPPGSGPDLTHHLLLVDYIERQGTLVRDAHAAAALGEMAHYTPGIHVLAVVAGALAGNNGFFAIYPVIAAAVATKFAVFALCLLRLFPTHPARGALAAAGVAMLFSVPAYTLGSFTHDSFFAQVVAELFAIAMWWTLVVWHQQPETRWMWACALFGVATFLTWPIWIGPLLVTATALIARHDRLEAGQRLRHVTIATAPIAVVMAVHAVGRRGALSLIGTSGAVSLPSLIELGWWVPILALVGLFIAARAYSLRPIVVLTVAIAVQALALFLTARSSGASTPYMALKMTYLAVYPLTAAGVAALGALRRPAVVAVAAALLLLAAARNVAAIDRPAPVVSYDLWAAGAWARSNLPPACVDYLVGNEYTAYWLHLAVLGNSRAAARSADNNTYLPGPAFARWVVDDDGPPFAIATLSVLPAEIRERTRTLHRTGNAVVIARPHIDARAQDCSADSSVIP